MVTEGHTQLNNPAAVVFSCEFCEMFKNSFFIKTPPGDCFLLLDFVSLDYSENQIKLACFAKLSTCTCILCNNSFSTSMLASYKICQQVWSIFTNIIAKLVYTAMSPTMLPVSLS